MIRSPRPAAVLAALGIALASTAAAPASAAHLPQTVALPNDLVAGDLGFQPEGVVVPGRTAYAGSLVDGTVVTADLRTGDVDVLVEPDGDPAVGLALAGRYLLVAGGPSGELRVYDRRTGDEVAVVDLGGGFVNDVTVLRGTAYVTDSTSTTLFAVPLRGRDAFTPREVTLSGDFALAEGFNANGVVGSRGTLVVAQSTDPDGAGSALYAVDPATGVADRIELRGGDVENADGLVLRGRTLYVVQNRSSSIAVVQLDGDLRGGEVTGLLTDDDLAVPTTADLALGALYTVNARFGTPPSDDVTYEIVRVALR